MANPNKNNRSSLIFLVFFFVVLAIVYLTNQPAGEIPSNLDVSKASENTIKIEAKSPATPVDIAISFVYDTSGSMNDKVYGEKGGKELKYVIASRALDKVVDRLQLFSEGSIKGGKHSVYIGLLGFNSIRYPMSQLNASNFKQWFSHIAQPIGGTPLGNTINHAGLELLKINAIHRHILVLTDGQNTEGDEPSNVIPKLKKLAIANGTSIDVHIIGFDVADSVFNPLKKEGVNVFSAINENELTLQLDKLLNEKILLEDDDSPVNVTPSK